MSAEIPGWRTITALEFETSYCRIWRNEEALWMASFKLAKPICLKVDSLKAAIAKAEKMYIAETYLPKPIVVRKKRAKKQDVVRSKSAESGKPVNIQSPVPSKKRKSPTSGKKRKSTKSTKSSVKRASTKSRNLKSAGKKSAK